MQTIRHARPEDASGIAAVWNPTIRNTVATFNSVERTAQDIVAMINARAIDGHPWLVAATPAGIAGFATCAQFRPGWATSRRWSTRSSSPKRRPDRASAAGS